MAPLAFLSDYGHRAAGAGGVRVEETLGRPRLHARRLASTNDRARELAHAGAPHGTLVTAAEQTAGRGRQGRPWVAPPGSALLCSLVLRDPPRLLPLLAAVALAEAVGPDARIKWPNDVLLGPRKLAGILAEARPAEGWAVLGMGVNVAVRPEEIGGELADRVATLGREGAAIEPFLTELLGSLARWLTREPAEILDALRARDALAGREVAWSGGQGRAEGVDGEGRLVVARADGGRLALDAGEVHLAAPRSWPTDPH